MSACGVVKQNASREANDKFMSLQVGMERDHVISVLGKPHKREVYGDREFLIYETNAWADSEKERYTPILIEQGKVVGWGRNYYDDTKRSKVEADIKVQSR